MKYRISPRVSNRLLKNLVVALITQAVNDYKHYVQRGWIFGDHALLKRDTIFTSRKQGAFRVRELLYFFRPGGGMDEWIEVAGLDVDASKIRQAIGFAK
jgi:hypothetical protein